MKNVAESINFTTGLMAFTKRAFHEVNNYPNKIGPVNCTHAHNCPGMVQYAIPQQKEVYSVKVQFVCNEQRVMTHAIVHFLGSSHDAHVFQMSAVRRELERRLAVQ